MGEGLPHHRAPSTVTCWHLCRKLERDQGGYLQHALDIDIDSQSAADPAACRLPLDMKLLFLHPAGLTVTAIAYVLRFHVPCRLHSVRPPRGTAR